jgi:predicted O-methyltransferase YrrM
MNLTSSIRKKMGYLPFQLWRFGETRKQSFVSREFRRETMSDGACLSALLGQKVSDQEVDKLVNELDAEFPNLKQRLEKHYTPEMVRAFESRHFTVGRSGKVFLYAALRILQPEVVVETGCAKGNTSYYILSALKKNNKGHLYSIDLEPELPERDTAPWRDNVWTFSERAQIGVLVPDFMRDRWTLSFGDTKQSLIPLLEKLKSVDVFFHDSDHSYSYMMWEYASAWPYLRSGGLLVSDDITMNASFYDFSNAHNLPRVIHANTLNVGALRKP